MRGDFGHAGANDCENLSGPIRDIATRLDDRIDVLISGHTHRAYICEVEGLLVTQGHHYGHLLTQLQVTLNAAGVSEIAARNILVDPARYKPDPDIAIFEADLVLRTSETLNRPIAKIGALSIDRRANSAGECAMGNLVADAQLAGTKYLGAQIALMNYGGIRGDLMVASLDDAVTFSQVAAVHPFKGTLQIAGLTGAELKLILEQQWPDDGDFNPLQVSTGFSYTWDAAQPRGSRISNMRLNGSALQMSETYQVVASAFLMDGGDGFKGFAAGKQRRDTRLRELLALSDFLGDQEAAGKPAGRTEIAGRVTRIH